MMRTFYDLNKDDFQAYCQSMNLPSYRAEQLYRWQAKWLPDFEHLSNFSKLMRAELAEHFSLPQLECCASQKSQDGRSQKFALRLSGAEIIEAVWMKHSYGNSLCLSTQVGCRMACKFCASEPLGWVRNLSQGELLAQFLYCSHLAGEPIGRLDLMGIGEPLDNYEAVLGFIKKLKEHEQINFSPRNITLSTVGLVPQIYKLADEALPLTLTISLHAPNQSLREQIMPMAKRHPLENLIKAANHYFQKTGRRISYEYALFKNVNDKAEQAQELVKLLRGQNCHVNLLYANEVEGTGFQASSKEYVTAFQNILDKAGIPVTVRRSLGQDITAACGQLRRRQLLAETEGK